MRANAILSLYSNYLYSKKTASNNYTLYTLPYTIYLSQTDLFAKNQKAKFAESNSFLLLCSSY